jgi:hypothetical protein
MKELDADILHTLKRFAIAGRRENEARRLLGVLKRRRQAFEARLETKLELLSDELEAAVMPKDHPAFRTVLMMAMIHKLTREYEEPEYESCLEFPSEM